MVRSISSIFLAFILLIIERCYSQCPPGYYLPSGSTTCTQITCVTGQYYDASQNQCLNCNQACSQCNYYSNFCLACQAGFYLYNNQCLTQCPQALTYVSCTSGTCTCLPCHSACTQCFGNKNTQCLACSVGYYYNQINTSCLSSCENGYTQQVIAVGSSSTLLCIPCDSNCLTCSQTNGKTCLQCKANMYLNTTTNQCVQTCPSLYYKINGQCQPCPSGCQTCFNTDPTNPSVTPSCNSCQANYWLSVETQSCVKTCPSGYVGDPKTLKCLPCDPSCVSCSDNTTQGCLQCQNGFSLTEGQPSACANICSAGNYYSNSLCLTCNTSCQQCFGSDSTQCIKCQTGYFLYKSSCVVVCPIAYYTFARSYADPTIQPICDYCPNEMEQCQQNTSNLSQITPILCKKGYYLQNGACVQTCADLTTYPDESSRSCLSCVFPCLTCLSDTVCLTCASYTPSGSSTGLSYIFAQITQQQSTGTVYQQNCVPTCPNGFYTNSATNSCSTCNQKCQTCSGPSETQCLTCQKYDNYNMLFGYNNQCYYTCPQSLTNPLYGDTTQQGCLPCSTECSSCFLGNNQSCYSCANGFFLEYLKPECKSYCASDGVFKNSTTNTCSLCLYGCATCTGGSANSCITCQNGYYLEEKYNVCSLCPSQCSSCTSQTVCQSCSSGYYYFSSTNSCLASCPSEGYYTNTSTNTCATCDPSCLECYGGLSTNCISCPAGFYLSTSGSCNPCNSCSNCSGPNTTDCLDTPTCTSTQFKYDGQCINCFTNCGTCSGTSYDACITCQSQTNYLQLLDVCKQKLSTSDSICDAGFYYDTSNSACYSCHPNCTQCTGKNSSQCTQCASGFLLHRDITTCNNVCLNGYEQVNTAIAECTTCQYGCNNGCSSGYSYLLGLCYSQCPFGTTKSQSNCNFNQQPSIQFATTLGNSVNNNSQEVEVQLFVYYTSSYSITWTLFQGTTDISQTAISEYLTNRMDYIVFPQKSLMSNTQYTLKASLLDINSNCKSITDCQISQTFQTMGEITKGTVNNIVDSTGLTLTLAISGWQFNGNIDNLKFDYYVKLNGNDYFFFDKGQTYSDGRFVYSLPSLSLDLTQASQAQVSFVIYNDYDIQLIAQSVALSSSYRNLAQITISLSDFSDSIYTQITTLQQIQRVSYQFYLQMQKLISSQTSSLVIFNRHLFYQVYYSIKGVQMECDSTMLCSGNGTCSWSPDSYNEVLCTCNVNFGGRYCEFQSYQLDIAKQHLIALSQKFSNVKVASSNDIFLAIEILLNLTAFQSIIDEFTLDTLISIYFTIFNQLLRIEMYISDEKILFKISKLTSQLINLINEIDTLSYNDQQTLLMNTMTAFNNQINLFLENFGDSYDDLRSLETVQTSFQSDIINIQLNLLYQNDMLNNFMLNDNVGSSDSSSDIQIVFYGDSITYTIDINQFSPKSSLSTAVIKWKSNPFLAQSQFSAPFISCITALNIYSEQSDVSISYVNRIIEIAIPKILPTPLLTTTRPFYQPYTCVYFDSVSQAYKQDGLTFLKENATHIICGSEQLSGNYGVIVNQNQIDSSVTLGTIWNATYSVFNNTDNAFINYMNIKLNQNNNNNTDNNNAVASQSTLDPHLSLVYAIIIYGSVIFLLILVSLIKDRRDKETYVKDSDTYWLTHPIYSLFFGPYSTFFPRISRSLNYAQVLINLFLFNAIFVRVYALPSDSELSNMGKTQVSSIVIGATAAVCSIFIYYLTICVINLFKMKWFIRQNWLDFQEEKITTEIVEKVIKDLKVFHLMNYGLIFILQIGMGIPIIILILTANSKQNQFFFTSVFASFVIDNVIDAIVLVGFCFIRIFSKSETSKLVLFFTLRGFYFPSSEFSLIEAKIRQFQIKGEISQQHEIHNTSDDEIFDMDDNLHNPKRIFVQGPETQTANQEEIQLTEFVNKIPVKL